MLATAACSSSSSQSGVKGNYNDIVAAAAKEKALSVCATIDPSEWAVVYNEFHKQYPKVKKMSYGDCQGVDTRQRMLNEMRAKHVTYDVMDLAAELLQDVAAAHVLATPDWSVFKNTPIKINPQVIAKRYGNSVVAWGNWSSVIAYNPKLVPRDKVPTTFEGCTKWNGKFLVDTRPQSFVDFYDSNSWGPTRLQQWAKAIAANKPTWVRGASAVLPSIASGEYPLFCGVQLHSTLRLLKENPNMSLKYVIPKETNADIGSKMAIAKNTDSPNSALLLTAWLASDAGQNAIAKANPGYGSPFIPTTEKAKMFKAAGTKPVYVGWQLPDIAPKATQLIVKAWGFPEPAIGGK